MNESALPELPGGWVWTRLGEIAEVITGNTPPKKDLENYGDYIPFVKPPELNDSVVSVASDNLSEKGAKLARILPPDSVLVSCIGNLGKIGINKIPVAFNQQINSVIFPKDEILPKYGFYYFQTLEMKKWLYGIASATTLPIVNKSKFETASIPLPPLPEQRRIVTKLEELFTRLDAGVSELKKTQAQLKRYRQSVLKAACEGKLVPTEAELAKAEGRAYEPADMLLAQILKERREKSKGAKYKEPVEPNIDGVTDLPEGWVWASIEQVTECLDHLRIPVNKKERAKRVGDIPYYGANGQVDWIDDYLFDEPLILVVEDETFIGREIPFCYKIIGKSWVNNHAHVLRATNAVNIDFLNYSLMYYPFTPLTTGTTGRKKLIKSVFMQAPYSLPPLAEQRRIVAEVERRLSIADRVEKTVTQSLAQAQRLRQSILKKAFEGRLVAQDAKDEPAGVLLEKIKGEMARMGKNKQKSKFTKDL